MAEAFQAVYSRLEVLESVDVETKTMIKSMKGTDQKMQAVLDALTRIPETPKQEPSA